MTKIIDERETALTDLNLASRAVYIAVDVLEDKIAAKLGVLRSDLRCLNVLGLGPMTATEIARDTGLTSGSVTALIDRLEKTGFVERSRSKTDRRSVVVTIRTEARPKLDALYSSIGKSISDQFSETEVSDIRVSTDVLTNFSKACRQAISVMSEEQ